MKVVRVPSACSKDILQQAKGIILIESTQIRCFMRWSGGGGWSSRTEAQRMPRVSKLRAKGLPDYNSNEKVVEAARQGASGPNKGLLSWHVYSKKESWKAALGLTIKGQKAAHQRKSTTDKKERIACSKSKWWCRWEKWRRWRWWWWVRTSRANHNSMWQHFGVLRHPKVGLNR
jgi:hypothetical protein